MPSYVRATVAEFVTLDSEQTLGRLETAYSRDGYATQFTKQTIAWEQFIPLFQQELCELQRMTRNLAGNWPVLLEFPLYRLRKRIDVVVLAGATIVVIEAKVGEKQFRKVDERQVEEYCLDLRDFHKGSQKHRLIPVLWCTDAKQTATSTDIDNRLHVTNVQRVGRHGLAERLVRLACANGPELIDGVQWDLSPYRPVPSIIDVATTIFSDHSVDEIINHDATNLEEAATRILQILSEAGARSQKVLIFVSGVPGSGKTLAGLTVVHDAVATGEEEKGDIVYLSGNTPLVTVLREALTEDEYARKSKITRVNKAAIRRDVRTRIQHINDFIKNYWNSESPPHEHAIVFDEAQRAWDQSFGERKFGRSESEPALLLKIMGRHKDWAACICLVGGGQEINDGEEGIAGWGRGLSSLDDARKKQWAVFAPPEVLAGGSSTGNLVLGFESDSIRVDEALQLKVPIRSYRSPAVSEWVSLVLDGKADEARTVSVSLQNYQIRLTRSLLEARQWLKSETRGLRRCGLVASSKAQRLRADGLGVWLTANDKEKIAHWYLKPHGDIRSSIALEVPANQFACQGLELDFVGVCWGGDLTFDVSSSEWHCRQLSSVSWNKVNNPSKKMFLKNSYRVLLTRAREGMIIWIPEGDAEDNTRQPAELNATAEFLKACGAVPL